MALSLTAYASESLNQRWLKLNDSYNFKTSKQSFCFKSDGRKTVGRNTKLKVRPASVSKLYTSLWALETLGANYQYQTKFIIKDDTLFIQGSKDPFFVSENLLVVMGELEKFGNFKRVVFDKNFYFNWSSDHNKIKSSLNKVLNSDLWDSYLNQLLSSLDIYIKDYNLSYVTPNFFEVKSIEYNTSSKPLAYDKVFTHLSSPLFMHLKQVNIYSNNFYSDHIFDQLGGQTAFHKYIYQKFSINSDDTYFYTGSGLGENRTTCSTTLKVLQALKKFASKNNLKLSDIVSVAGSDKGTLENRFKNEMANTVIAKTGTLRHTSTLAGYVGKNQNKLFAVFNHTYESKKARELQNEFVTFYAKKVSAESFTYEPLNYVSIFSTEIR